MERQLIWDGGWVHSVIGKETFFTVGEGSSINLEGNTFLERKRLYLLVFRTALFASF
jgi:hypothetical protein